MEKIIIIDEANDRKWEIEKQENELYKFTYYEYFTQRGWRETGKETDYTKEAIEALFDIKITDNSKIFVK